jgi:two-component system NtrC family sensor kinase
VQSKHELEATSEALKASEIKYKSLVNNLRSAIVTVNKHGDILTINKGGIKLLGCKSKTAAKQSNLFKDYGIPKEDCNTLIKLLRAKGFVENFETILIKKTGEKAIIRISSQLIMEPDNQIERIDSIIRNITSLKLAEAEKSALEEELFHAEKLASIGQLAAGVAHEINNPLTNISLLTTSIRRKTKDKVILDKLNKLTQQRKIAAKIVNDLLQFSRKTEPKFKKLNLAETIEAALTQVVQNNVGGVKVTNKTTGKDLLVRGDPDLLRQVFINIFENAYDEMPNGGNMVINSKPVGLDYIEIEIADSGPGIPENIIGKIFDPFFSTKQAEKGTGLGLSICHGIIKTHEGKIYAQNHESRGASFFIQLPRWIDEV